MRLKYRVDARIRDVEHVCTFLRVTQHLTVSECLWVHIRGWVFACVRSAACVHVCG